MTVLDARQSRRWYLLLLALRWLPTGLLIPVATLLALDRGLSLVEIGLAMATQGVVVAILELPTGGLADSLGRRPVLLLAGVAGVASLGVLVIADSAIGFATAWALQGVFRALDSGPLESWYVETVLATDPDAALHRGLGAGGAVLGLAVATGAVAAGVLVAFVAVPGLPSSVVPVLVALAAQIVGLIALAFLPEPRRTRGRRAVWRALRAVPGVIVDGVRDVRRSPALAGLVAVELLWGIGIVTVEQLLPVRFVELTGDTAGAAILLGPAVAGAWLVSAAGAALASWLGSRIGVSAAAAACRVAQGAAVVGMGLLAGTVGALTGFLMASLLNGAAAPLHATLVHRRVDSERRTTMLSINSMAAQLGGTVGLIALLALAEATTTVTAMVVGGAVLAAAAPLYLPSRRTAAARR